MQFKSYDGTSITYLLKRGKIKTTLVFLHGWANNWTSWRKTIVFFQKRGYSTLAIDLRGHGKSGIPPQVFQYRLSCFAKDLHLLCKKEKLNQIILVGHSMGGMIALTYYAQYKKNVRGLVLASTTYKRIAKEKFTSALSPLLQQILRAIAVYHKYSKKRKVKAKSETDFSKFTERKYPLLIKEAYKHTPLMSMFGCLEGMFDYNAAPVLPNIKVPALILYGKYEFVFPKEIAEYMHDHIPHSEIHEIKNSLHFAHLSQSRETNKYIQLFLENHGL
jgi:pimeloyl-ACP methyl ester carboxylesterase